MEEKKIIRRKIEDEPIKEKFNIKNVWKLFKETISNFMGNNPMIYCAAIAFYTIFSLPAIILIMIAVAGLIFGEDNVSGQLYDEINQAIGPESAETIQKIVQNSSTDDSSWISTIISIATLAFSATTVFVTLQTSLNKVWGMKPKPKTGIFKLVMDRILSFAMVSGMGFLLAVSLLLDTLIFLFSEWINQSFERISVLLVYLIEKSLSFAILILVFALLYKTLPDAKIRWKDTWFGAFITTILFIIGKFLIGIYIGNSEMGTTYGAAGSFVIILIWVYYSSIIVLFGAEVTQTFTRLFGDRIRPSSYAIKVETQEVEKEKGSNAKGIDER